MSLTNKLLLSTVIGLTGLATAQAEFTATRLEGVSLGNPTMDQSASTSDIYVVQMKGDPVIAYEGDVRGFKATKPGKGKKINPKSAHVKKYAAHLESQQAKVIKSARGEKVYSYRYAFNGFAARMTEAAAKALRKRGDVINVWRDEIHQLQTDGSPNYIGLTEGGEAWSKGLTGENVVIGSIDTGIWPEHPSFADSPTQKKGNKGPEIAYGPVPDGFTSSGCDFGPSDSNPYGYSFDCNNKVITARCYNKGFSSDDDPDNVCGGNGDDIIWWDFQSARDADGHGSHTAGTAGGNYGVPAEINGEFKGIISGVAPRARIAAYKVCWTDVEGDGGCASSDSAAAIDQAVLDGVDVINFSIGGPSNSFSGPDDIAFLFAADAGVWVATSNGNSGPDAGTVGTPSGVPWITAVGATQDDGVFSSLMNVNAPAPVAGEYNSVAANSSVTLNDTGPITDDVTMVSGDGLACDPIDPISGIALASRGDCAFTVKFNNAAAAGAVAIIVYNNSDADPIIMSAPGTTIPGVMISQADGLLLAGATGVNATLEAVSGANRIAGFSSRGPNNGALDIIKPDLSAPGVATLAATTPWAAGEYYMSINGTSMASPHVAGSFALLKQAHPDWSPAIARSALMTTARNGLLKTTGDELADPFDVGAGEILPSDAVDPGLAYDAGLFEYAAFSCENNFQIFSDASCDFLESIGVPSDGSDLNLPSIGIGELIGSQTITRTVTAVYNNNGSRTFNVSVDAPPGIAVSVSPTTMKLRKGQSADFEVTFSVTGDTVMDEWAFGSLAWTDEGHQYAVRSPIAIYPTEATKPSLFAKTVDTDTASAGDTLTYEINVTNGPLAGPITVTDAVPDGTTFVPGSETESVTKGSTTTPWAYDSGSNSLTWEGTLDVSTITVETSGSPYGYVPLSLFFDPAGCPSNCDDGAFIFNVPAFTYNGTVYNEMIVSVNGTLEAGSVSGLATSYANQNLPDETPPNNLIAPYWRDLNLGIGGDWYVGVLNGGGDQWTIYEWENVPIFGDPNVAYTFQVWVGNNGYPSEGRIWYVYDRIDNTDDGTVGAENSDGTVGDSYFYDGAGTAPEVGVDLEVIVTPGGTATLGFQVETDCSVDPVLNVAGLSSEGSDESASALTACQ